jgi:hypothetical protein
MVPHGEPHALARRRVAATRDLMQQAAGVSGARIVTTEPPPVPAPGKPRVDFRPKP